MYISDKIVFIELHKTGCTHIGRLLAEIVAGQQIGKHNPAKTELFTPGRYFFGSVRNPWDWYVSLWAYGCDGRGAIYNRVTRRRRWIRSHGWNRNPIKATRSLYGELCRKPEKWRHCYTHAGDASAFRDWLHMMHDKRTFLDLGNEYSSSQISSFAGLLTYRYMNLFCKNRHDLNNGGTLTDVNALEKFEQANCYITNFIRNESLESDLIEALEACGIRVSENQKSRIYRSEKTNTSSRKHPSNYYYDRETVEIIHKRESLIIEKFGYLPPDTR